MEAMNRHFMGKLKILWHLFPVLGKELAAWKPFNGFKIIKGLKSYEY